MAPTTRQQRNIGHGKRTTKSTESSSPSDGPASGSEIEVEIPKTPAKGPTARLTRSGSKRAGSRSEDNHSRAIYKRIPSLSATHTSSKGKEREVESIPSNERRGKSRHLPSTRASARLKGTTATDGQGFSGRRSNRVSDHNHGQPLVIEDDLVESDAAEKEKVDSETALSSPVDDKPSRLPRAKANKAPPKSISRFWHFVTDDETAQPDNALLDAPLSGRALRSSRRDPDSMAMNLAFPTKGRTTRSKKYSERLEEFINNLQLETDLDDCEDIMDILSRPPPPDPREWKSRATLNREKNDPSQRTFAPLISGTTAIEQDRFRQELTSRGAMLIPRKRWKRLLAEHNIHRPGEALQPTDLMMNLYIKTCLPQHLRPVDKDQWMFMDFLMDTPEEPLYQPSYVETEREGSYAKRKYAEVPEVISGTAQPWILAPPGSGVPEDALNHHDVLVEFLDNYEFEREPGWTKEALAKIPDSVLARVRAQTLAKFPDEVLNRLPPWTRVQLPPKPVYHIAQPFDKHDLIPDSHVRGSDVVYGSGIPGDMEVQESNVRDGISLPETDTQAKLKDPAATSAELVSTDKDVLQAANTLVNMSRGGPFIQKPATQIMAPDQATLDAAKSLLALSRQDTATTSSAPKMRLSMLKYQAYQNTAILSTEGKPVTVDARPALSAGGVDEGYGSQAPSTSFDYGPDEALLGRAFHSADLPPAKAHEIVVLESEPPGDMTAITAEAILALEPIWRNLPVLEVFDLSNQEFQEEHFASRPSIRLSIPDQLKGLLVDDWENVTKSLLLVPLPSQAPANFIIDTYFNEEKHNRRLGSADSDLLLEFCCGLKLYFEKAVGKILLYRFERLQLAEVSFTSTPRHSHVLTTPQVRKLWESGRYPEWADRGPGDCYGAEHLTRMIGTVAVAF